MPKVSKIRHVSTILLCCLLAALFVVATLVLSRQTYQIELDINATNTSAFRVSWTTPGEKFTPAQSTSIRISPGVQRYRLEIRPEAPRFHLRFKTSTDTQEFSIDSIKIRRLGRQSLRLTGVDVVNRAFSVNRKEKPELIGGQAVFKQENGQLIFRLDQLEVGKKRTPKYPLLLMLIVSVFVFVVCRRVISHHATKSHWLNYSLLFLFAVWWLQWTHNLLPLAVNVMIQALGVVLLLLRLGLYWVEFLDELKVSRINTRKQSTIQWTVRHLRNAILPLAFFGFVFYVGAMQVPLLTGFDTSRLLQLHQFKNARDEFSGFYKENFAFKDEFIGLNSEVNYSLLKTSSIQKMMVGKGGIVFEGRGKRRVENTVIRTFDNYADYLGRIPYTEKQLQKWARILEQRRDYLAAKGIPYIFAIAPTKGMIYPEKLPWAFRIAEKKPSRYDQLYDYVSKKTTVPIVDLRQALLRAKAEHDYPSLYYSFDFHWNMFGAFFAYREIVEVANKHYPELALKPLELSDFSINLDEKWIDFHHLYALGLKPYAHHTDTYVRLKPTSMDRFPKNGVLPESGIEDIHLSYEKFQRRDKKPYSMIRLKNPAGEKPMMVIYGDSFIYKTMLYFSAHAQELYFKRAVFEFPLAVFDENKPDLVIQETLNMYILLEPPENVEVVRAAKPASGSNR